MTLKRQLSEKEKLYFFTLLIPPLWFLAIAMAITDLFLVLKKTITTRRGKSGLE